MARFPTQGSRHSLLGRKQFICDVIHPCSGNVSKKDLAAKLAGSDKWWQRWSMASCGQAEGTHSKVVFGDKAATAAAKNVPYCKAEFVPDPAGLFYSMDSTAPDFDKAEFNEAVRAMLLSHASGAPTPVWDTCYVAHDSFALDVDDLPAIELARGVTKPDGFHDMVTWRESSA